MAQTLERARCSDVSASFASLIVTDRELASHKTELEVKHVMITGSEPKSRSSAPLLWILGERQPHDGLILMMKAKDLCAKFCDT